MDLKIVRVCCIFCVENNEKLEVLSLLLYGVLLVYFVIYIKLDFYSCLMYNYQVIIIFCSLINILIKICCFEGFGIFSKLWDYSFGIFFDKLNVKVVQINVFVY